MLEIQSQDNISNRYIVVIGKCFHLSDIWSHRIITVYYSKFWTKHWKRSKEGTTKPTCCKEPLNLYYKGSCIKGYLQQ